jgi:hypothetical protein
MPETFVKIADSTLNLRRRFRVSTFKSVEAGTPGPLALGLRANLDQPANPSYRRRDSVRKHLANHL